MSIQIPHDVEMQIDAYVNLKTPPGNFLRAVLENDLRGAVRASAGSENEHQLVEIVSFCIEYIPLTVWGSPEAVNTHLDGKGWADEDHAENENG